MPPRSGTHTGGGPRFTTWFSAAFRRSRANGPPRWSTDCRGGRCSRSASARASHSRATHRTSESWESTCRPTCLRWRAAAWSISVCATSRACWKWTPRRRTSPMGSSIRPWRCSWPRSCRNPRQLLAELRRVVRPGGNILFVNHFAAEGGPRWWVERAMAPASRRLGWHPDFAVEALFEPDEIAGIAASPMPPFGIFTLVRLRN